MENQLAYTVSTEKPFDQVVKAIEEKTADNKFRVLHTHDVKATLNEKGFERAPLKIIEVCNAGFANEALGKELMVAMFMPCKFVVAEVEGQTSVTLVRPTMISQMLPDTGLEDLAASVETTLRNVMDEAVK